MSWYQLRMPCPIENCENRTKMLSWVCSNDHDNMYVCETGRLACSTGKHNDLVCNWKFDCGDRAGAHRNIHFLKPDMTGLCHALAIAVPLLPLTGHEWLSKLLKNIDEQYKT